MTNTDVWAWADDDDDLQKALRASLAEAEGETAVVMEDEAQDGLPAEIQSSYQRVVNSWERNKRVMWTPTHQALEAALRYVDHTNTKVFVNQMIPEIISVCVENCEWGQIIEDRADKEDYSKIFRQILQHCLDLILHFLRLGSADLLAPLNTLLDDTLTLWTKRPSATSLRQWEPPLDLYERFVDQLIENDVARLVLDGIERWRWSAVLQGWRFMLRLRRSRAFSAALAQALAILQRRMSEGALQLWREEPADAAAMLKELSSSAAALEAAAAAAAADAVPCRLATPRCRAARGICLLRTRNASALGKLVRKDEGVGMGNKPGRA